MSPVASPRYPSDSAKGSSVPRALESTTSLLSAVRAGDSRATERLLARFLPILRRWAHRRLPLASRDLADTDDLVQVTLLRALKHVGEFEQRSEGAFLAYLRGIFVNAMRDEMRRAARRGHRQSLDDPEATGLAAVERGVGTETLARYERGLSRLPDEQRELVILRIEMGYSHAEIAEAVGRPSADAARTAAARAIAALAEEMRGIR